METCVFDPFFHVFLVTKWPIFKAFATLEGPKWLKLGSTRAHFTSLCTCTPNGTRSVLEKHFLTHP